MTSIDTPHAYKLSELVLSVSECVEAVSEWCRSVSIDTSVGRVDSVQVPIDTSVKVSSRGSTHKREKGCPYRKGKKEWGGLRPLGASFKS